MSRAFRLGYLIGVSVGTMVNYATAALPPGHPDVSADPLRLGRTSRRYLGHARPGLSSTGREGGDPRREAGAVAIA